MQTTRSSLQLPDLLLIIGIEKRTGELVVESGNNIGSLLFHEGRILIGFSPYTRAIGDQLVEQGVISEAELLSALKEQRAGASGPLGSILIARGKVSLAAVEQLVHEQIRKAVADFTAWNPIEFNFVQRSILPADSIHLPVFEFLPPDMLASLRAFVRDIPSS